MIVCLVVASWMLGCRSFQKLEVWEWQWRGTLDLGLVSFASVHVWCHRGGAENDSWEMVSFPIQLCTQAGVSRPGSGDLSIFLPQFCPLSPHGLLATFGRLMGHIEFNGVGPRVRGSSRRNKIYERDELRRSLEGKQKETNDGRNKGICIARLASHVGNTVRAEASGPDSSSIHPRAGP